MEPDPNLAFDPVEFRTNIRAAMVMGTPNMVADRPTFHFVDTRVYAGADLEGSPFDWEATATGEAPPEPVQVACAVESIGQGEASEGTNIGTFDMNRARLYILDEDWAAVQDFVTVWLSGSEYIRVKQLPILTLFEVDVHCVEIHARDES
jgi:hypothetical protein